MDGSPPGLGRRSSCVKVYLSSNPEDSAVERRALRETVFPRLREHCRHTLGVDVRVIDPFESSDPSRWPDQTVRQQLMQECRESSAGPFFIALVGHRYGTAGIPVRVEVAEYQQLLQVCQQKGIGTQVLERSYVRDENTVPPSYRLLRPLTHAHRPQQSEVQGNIEVMADTEEELRRMFQTAEGLCEQEKLMTSEDANSYYRSALEADLRFALEDQSAEDIRRCLVYVHKIIHATGQKERDALEQMKQDSQARLQVKATPHMRNFSSHQGSFPAAGGICDRVATKWLQSGYKETSANHFPWPVLHTQSDELFISRLCVNFLPGLVASHQLLVYTTATECDPRHGYTSARRRGYAESLCQQLYSDLLGLIDSSITSESSQPSSASQTPCLGASLAREQAEQAELCSILSRLYHVVQPEEEQVRAYVEQAESRCPMVVAGGPCTGKTVLLAHCAQQIKSWLADSDPVVIPYFFNLSINPTLKHLLSSLCYQIAHGYSESSDPSPKPDSKPFLHPKLQSSHTSTFSGHPCEPHFYLGSAPPLDPHHELGTEGHHPQVNPCLTTVRNPDPGDLCPNPDAKLRPADHKPSITDHDFKSHLTFTQLKERLSSLLFHFPSTKRPVVLMLDGIDQTDENHACPIIQCLPSPLPPSVKLILAVSTNQVHILQAIKLHYPQCNTPPYMAGGKVGVEKKVGERLASDQAERADCVYVELKATDRKTRVRMVASLLNSAGRRVTSGQQAILNQALTSCSLMLYARLLHIHALLWSSDSEVTESLLPDGVHSSISALLDHLEEKHSSSLVCRSLSYITLSRTGLTEAELTDLLSSDDKVLVECTEQGEAPLLKTRVLQVDVERLLLDLRQFLVRRKVAGTQVLFWISRHFGLVVGKRYLGTQKVRKEIHSLLADYFSGQRGYGRVKSLDTTNESGLNNTTTTVSATDQPFVFKPLSSSPSSKGIGLVNLRKILELPHHLRKSERWEELEREVMMSLGFHQAMVRADLLGDLVTMLEGESGLPQASLPREGMLLASILKSSACLLQSLPLELSMVMETRLLPYLGVYPELGGYARDIWQERRKRGCGVGVALHPAPTDVPSFHSSLSTARAGESVLVEAAVTECGTVVGVMDDGSAWIWKVPWSEGVELSLRGEQSKLKFVGVKSSSRFILLPTHCYKLLLWDAEGPEMLLVLEEPLRTELGLNVTEGFVVSQGKLCIWWKGKNSVSVFDISNNESLTHFQCPSSVTCLVWSSDACYIFCGQEKGKVSIFDMNTNNFIGVCSNPNQNAILSVIVCEEKWEMACLDTTGTITLWNIEAKIQPVLLKECFGGSNTTKIFNTDYSEELCTLLVCEAHQVTLWDTCEWVLWGQFLAPQGRAFIHAVLAEEGHLFLALLESCPLVFVWRISTGECVLSLDTGANTLLLTLIKAASNLISVAQNGCLTMWDSKLLYAAGLASKMGSGVKDVVVELMDKHFYTTDGSETVWGWNLETGISCSNFLHDCPVEKLCLSPDKKHLLTLSGGDIYLWQTETGQNTQRISGSRATDILITLNGHFGVSLSERALSRVWKLANGVIVCNIHLYLTNAQVSPESTYLIGCYQGDLLAVGLWSGYVSKRFSCTECSEHILAFHTLPEQPEFVMVMDASGTIFTWKVAEETVCRQFQLPSCFQYQLQILQMSSNGNFVLLSTDDEVITILDLFRARLCLVKVEGAVFKAGLDKCGCYAAYISHPPAQGNCCLCNLHGKCVLTVVRLADGLIVGRLRLCKTPLTLVMHDQPCVFVGFKDGSVGVYSILDVTMNDGEFIKSRENLISQQQQCPCDKTLNSFILAARPFTPDREKKQRLDRDELQAQVAFKSQQSAPEKSRTIFSESAETRSTRPRSKAIKGHAAHPEKRQKETASSEDTRRCSIKPRRQRGDEERRFIKCGWEEEGSHSYFELLKLRFKVRGLRSLAS
ncbi:NACHT and WD repeat domain-containing protein 2-like [Lampris incognitus]|uniref:NACHT and WD repeat domain-containing protein 2-like n=1 Tax=Lampris incognitus TaxID=2546036 RepID=UPI0024B481E3|nr:NACHT and WD repeat domain-containing protein 2-like [Lampris incognitus]